MKQMEQKEQMKNIIHIYNIVIPWEAGRSGINLRVSEDFVLTTYERLFCPKAIRIPQF